MLIARLKTQRITGTIIFQYCHDLGQNLDEIKSRNILLQKTVVRSRRSTFCGYLDNTGKREKQQIIKVDFLNIDEEGHLL